MTDAMNVFDRRIKRRHRDRAAPRLTDHDFLHREVAERLLDRLDDIRRAFPLALDLGAHGGHVARLLAGRHGVETLIQSDLSERMARRLGGFAVVADEEALPFAEKRFDLIFSNLALHWVNDLPGALLQIRRCLKPDGLFLGALLGGRTLGELREALLAAEIEIAGGAGPRVSPFADVGDLGGLMQRAGFALPVVDSDTITVEYSDALALMRDLRGMGESNAVADRPRGFRRREIPARAAVLYEEMFGSEGGRVPATFQIIYLTGWAPDAKTQQQPLRPGSAAARLADALGSEEKPAGDKTPVKKSSD